MEHPEIGCRLVDLTGTDFDQQTDLLFQDVLSQPAENQIAYRVTEGKSQRYVARLAESTGNKDESDTDGMHVPADSPFRLRIMSPAVSTRSSMKHLIAQNQGKGKSKSKCEPRA